MTTYPSSLSPAPALTDEGTLEAALDCLLESVPLNMEGGHTPQDLFEILLRAASRGDSIEYTAQRLHSRQCWNSCPRQWSGIFQSLQQSTYPPWNEFAIY